MATFRISPTRSKVFIEARSSLHPITGEAGGLEGSVEAEVADGSVTLSDGAKIAIELPVERLSSGKRMEDAEMYRRIDARRYPSIRGDVREITLSGPNPGSGVSPYSYRLRGDLTFHGVTKPVEGDVRLSSPDARTIVIEGEQTFDIRDYGVQPPKILMLKVHPEVKVRVRVVAEQEG